MTDSVCYVQIKMDHSVNLDTCQFPLFLTDHIGGFPEDLKNPLLVEADLQAQKQELSGKVVLDMPLEKHVKDLYPNLQISYRHDSVRYMWEPFESYHIHPEINYQNFLCSFNGSHHVSRQLLVSALMKRGWFDSEYSSKHFVFDVDRVQGHIKNFVGEQEQLYSRLFTDERHSDFYSKIYEVGNIQPYKHLKNISQLEQSLTQSFVHVVSESLGTSYYPFITEKFLYSVVTRGLFVAYAQPRWHRCLELFYGFKNYRKLFDFEFDEISCPIKRLDRLMCMVSKFSNLSKHDWQDLYDMESDTIEYNYDWYFSKNYVKHLEKFFS